MRKYIKIDKYDVIHYSSETFNIKQKELHELYTICELDDSKDGIFTPSKAKPLTVNGVCETNSSLTNDKKYYPCWIL